MQSIEDYTRALSLDPKHVNAAYARAACLNKKGEFESAIRDYQIVNTHLFNAVVNLSRLKLTFGRLLTMTMVFKRIKGFVFLQ